MIYLETNMLVDFLPREHSNAYKEGRLFEWRDVVKEDEIKGKWAKVEGDETYKDALNNPIFFAVEIGL